MATTVNGPAFGLRLGLSFIKEMQELRTHASSSGEVHYYISCELFGVLHVFGFVVMCLRYALSRRKQDVSSQMSTAKSASSASPDIREDKTQCDYARLSEVPIILATQ
ncbi:hypothetical protein Y032_0083g1689 [Ancylostoma ceylanicum]|uniref:Uncharacterized protein n=1 Tax=Ancylostoma ceylanicum TaxID=53326 RepID=A0A016TSC4_9BILA|nr:hypothetical protein Y032_0083g1689 [Ancylostoma ceylanicum]